MRQKKSIKSKHIGLFGGSFNPPHLGHRAVLEHLVRESSFDEIWIIPVLNHPYDKSLADYDTRIRLINMLLEDISEKKLKISEIERDLNKRPCYTFDWVQKLKSMYPDKTFSIILGTDARTDLPNWYRIEDLKKETDFYYIRRKGYEKSDFPKVSSSDIRAKLKTGHAVDRLTIQSIADYLHTNKIY